MKICAVVVALVALPLTFTGCASGPAHAPSSTPAASASTVAATLQWRSFGAEAFAEAKREHKLVFVDAGIEGCTACRWMHETTLADPRVIERLQRGFVVVSVDADQQPDLGARFEEWAWPALVFLDGDGHIIRAVRGNKVPEHFLPLLDDVERASSLSASARAASSVSSSSTSIPPLPTSPASSSCGAALAELDRRVGKPVAGGPIHIEGAPVVVDLARDDAHVEAGRVLVASSARLVDPVWGGVFVGAYPSESGPRPIPEKRAEHEAYALELFAAAAARDHDQTARAAIGDVVKYLRETLSASDGTFFSTQRDGPPGLPSPMTAGDYYALSDLERRKLGVPAVDHGVYTDQNGRLIAALAHAADATGDISVLALATRAADALLAGRMRPEGWVLQAIPSDLVQNDPRLRPVRDDARPYLRAQASFGFALVALYSSTGDGTYLKAAEKIAAALAVLADPGGGYFDTTARDVDAVAGRQKSAADNIMAARFLLALADVTHDDAVGDAGHRALAAVAARGVDETTETVGQLVLASHEDARGFVLVSVAGDARDPAVAALLTAGRAAHAPSKLVMIDVAGKYPRAAKAAAYVCDRNACSAPVMDPGKIADVVRRASRPLDCAASN